MLIKRPQHMGWQGVVWIIGPVDSGHSL